MRRSRIFGGIAFVVAAAAGMFRQVGGLITNWSGLESRVYSVILGLALLMILIQILRCRGLRYLLKIELVLFASWLSWAYLSDVFSAATGLNVAATYRNVSLAGLTMLATSVCTAMSGSVAYVAAGALTAGIALFAASILSGEAILAFVSQGYRLGNEVGNANEWAYVYLLAFAGALALLQRQPNKAIRKVWVLMAFLPILTGMVMTGSRKAFFAVLFLSLASVLISLAWKGISWRRMLFALGVLTTLLLGISQVYERTVLGERLKETTTIQSLTEREQERLGYYQQLPEILAEHPISGVGLGRWTQVSFTGKAAHSEYVAVLGETGLVGGALYFGLYIVLILRLMKGIKLNPSASMLKVLLAVVIALQLVAAGRWNYSNPFHYALIGGIIGYSWQFKLMKVRLLNRV